MEIRREAPCQRGETVGTIQQILRICNENDFPSSPTFYDFLESIYLLHIYVNETQRRYLGDEHKVSSKNAGIER